jgi:hypothetical protein
MSVYFFVVEGKEKRRLPSFLAIVGKGYFCVVISTESFSYWLIYMRLIALWLAEYIRSYTPNLQKWGLGDTFFANVS